MNVRRDLVSAIALTVALCALVVAFAAYARLPEQPEVLSNMTPVIVHWQTLDGTEVKPPEVMPLWQYVEPGDTKNAEDLLALKLAFESDLEAKDPTFHKTHELIDGKQW